MAETIRQNLGPVSAYALAKKHGYTGTEEEFSKGLYKTGEYAQEAKTAAAGATAEREKAKTAAGNAQRSETAASGFASTAAGSAERAETAKSGAETAAGNASQSAEAAAGSATQAGNEVTKAEAAAGKAETAQKAAENAATNIKSHNGLTGREMTDQHPISSIHALQDIQDALCTRTLANGIDKNDYTDNGYWNFAGTGKFTAYNGYAALNKYFDVKPNTVYSLWLDGVRSRGASICWYDFNKKFISGVNPTAVDGYVAPENAFYARLSMDKNRLDIACFSEGDIYAGNSAFGYKITIKQENFDVRPNLIDCNKYILSGYYIGIGESSGVTLVKNNWGIDAYKIPVVPGERYIVIGQGYQSVRLWAVLDEKLTAVSQSKYSDSLDVKTAEISIPLNGKFLCVNVGRGGSFTEMTKVQKYEQTLKPEIAIPRLDMRVLELENKISKAYNPLYGKKLATAGDSITQGIAVAADPATGYKLTYGGFVAVRNKMVFKNYGISGSTLQNIPDRWPFSVDRYKQMDVDIDYLTICFGWNDYANGTLGTPSDTTNETFYGAWNVVLPYLIEKYPKAKIGLIVPYGCSKEIRESVRVMAKKYGLPYMDMTGDPNIPVMYNREDSFGLDEAIAKKYKDRYLYDGLHPNEAGYEAWSTAFESFLRSM